MRALDMLDIMPGEFQKVSSYIKPKNSIAAQGRNHDQEPITGSNNDAKRESNRINYHPDKTEQGTFQGSALSSSHVPSIALLRDSNSAGNCISNASRARTAAGGFGTYTGWLDSTCACAEDYRRAVF
jgi:hypothetical protein